ncbi:glycosyltransferase [Acidipropionibacterium jensenii]|uniref:glycosyltransferase n=1 Tax=Acidipropionibacterium jensenii TaxID=1749 RepID=UPI00214BB7F2|nr:galactosyltransferase-related protein [Acidipropionibacterium jensenii]
MSIDIGVVVIAHGRHDHLRRTLRSLALGELLPDQVVVVAMADPMVASLVEDLELPMAVRVVDLDADPARLPLAAARNVGARSAHASRLVFLDVDCLASPALLRAYRDALDHLAAPGGGPVVVAGPVTYLPEGWHEGSEDELDWAVVSALRNPHAARPDPPAGDLLREDRFELFWSLSFAVTRGDLARIGGFDESYEGYGGEDTDFAERLRASGGGLWWVGGADAYHQHHPVSTPPVEHLDDILRNVGVFQQRWGRPCMDGWLDAFATLGLAVRDADGTWRRTGDADPSRGDVLHVVAGPDHHGIARHAQQLVTLGQAPCLRLLDAASREPRTLARTITTAADGRGVHLHLNDTLLGPGTVGVVAGVAARVPVSLTLHDLPDPREGAARYDRRARACAELWRLSCGVVVASWHERGLLVDAARHAGEEPDGLPPVAVVPLPLAPPVADAPVDADHLEPVVGVLGYVYPGKGHEQAIHLAAALGLPGVVALGTPSHGHQQLVDDLHARAQALDTSFEVTGFLDDDALLSRARRVAVPLAWHAHASASGSIGSWLEAGRCPLVADGGWVRELAERCPGAVTVVGDQDALRTLAAIALADPSTTVLAPGTRLRPTPVEAWQATRDAVARFHQEGHHA